MDIPHTVSTPLTTPTDHEPQQFFHWLDDMPIELWADIFLQISNNILSPPWFLGHICHHWRQIALCTPLLWNRIPPLYIGSEGLKSERMKAYVKELLARSSNAPLFLHIAIFTTMEEPNEVISLLLHHSKRWRGATLEELAYKHIQTQHTTTNIQFPELLSITFQFRELPAICITFLSHVPRLRHVKIGGRSTSLDSDTGLLGIPWLQIEDYEQRGGSAEQLLHILQLSPRLRTISLGYQLPRPPKQLIKVTHSQLRQLLLQDRYDGKELIVFFQVVSLPALEELTFSGEIHCDLGASFLQTLASFIHRSKCSLFELKLLFHLPTDALIDFLHEMPRLKKLILRVQLTPDLNILWDALIPKSTKPSLLPCLTCMILKLELNWGSRHLRDSILNSSAVLKILSSPFTTSDLPGPLTALQLDFAYYLNYERKFKFLYTLQGIDLMDLRSVIGKERQYQQHSSFFHKGYVSRAIKELVTSEEKRAQYTVQHMFVLLDLIHLISSEDVKSEDVNFRIAMYKELEVHKLISTLDDKLHLRQYIFLGRRLIYVPPNHGIRRSIYRWYLVLGGGNNLFPFLTGEDFKPSNIPEYFSILDESVLGPLEL